MHRRRRSTVISAMLVALFLLPIAAFSGDSSDLEDSRVQEVLLMTEAGMSEQVILARVEQIGAFPILEAIELAELKKRGVSDRVLMYMIEHGQVKASGEPAATAPVAQDPPPAVEDAEAGIRVVVVRSFRVTYIEVALGGEIVQHSGRLWEGKSDPGVMLKRPRILRGDEVFTAYEAAVQPGTHEVAVGFAFSAVEGDPRDEWAEFEGEWYVTRGVRAGSERFEKQNDEDNPGATCSVEAGQICEVTATFHKKAPTPLGGLPDYSVTYEVRTIN